MHQAIDRLGLRRRHLDCQDTAGPEILRGLRHQGAQDRVAVGPGEERARRLMGELRRERLRLVLGEVGRVRDEEVETLAADRLEEGTLGKLDTRGEAKHLRVRPRHRKRLRRDVGGEQARLLPLMRKRKGDRARARPEIEHAHLAIESREKLEGHAHERFAFRSWR